MAWIEMRLRGARVWMLTDEQGQPGSDADSRVEIVYRPGGKSYRAALKNLESVPGAAPVLDVAPPLSDSSNPPKVADPVPGPAVKPARGAGKKAVSRATGAHAGASDPNAILVYTDGACTGNPGPMGIGAVILDPHQPSGPGLSPAGRRELSVYLGKGTNNIAELAAIQHGLAELPRERSIVVFSDSSYSIGVLSQGWKARANQELVGDIRRLLGEFANVVFVKVAGHAGVPENERCDELARQAITRRGAG